MTRFWAGLWLYWALWVSLISVLLGAAAAVSVTLMLYFLKGAVSLDSEVLGALLDIGAFWFAVTWSLALPLALLLVVKRLFYRCIDHWKLILLSCDGKEQISDVGVADTLKLWRKWLFVIIWAVAVQTLLVAGVAYLLGLSEGLMGWFGVGWLYLFVLGAGAMTLPLMAVRCNMVKVLRC